MDEILPRGKKNCVDFFLLTAMVGTTTTITITLLALQAMQTAAFSGVSSSLHIPVSRNSLSTSPITSLLASSTDDVDDVDNDALSRRDATFKIVSAAATIASIPSLVNAEEDTGGKLIEFTVQNLGGEEGKTGSFVVKTHPEWAPIGVERFETLAANKFFDDW